MPQDGAQTAGEGQALFLVNWNLGDAADLIFDRVLDGDDLVLVGLDFVDSGVKRRRLAAAGWPGN